MSGYKVRMNEHLIYVDCIDILKQYEVIHVHAPTKGNYLPFFLQGWVTNRKGFRVNWAQYTYDIYQ
jgi:hypothetical protein